MVLQTDQRLHLRRARGSDAATLVSLQREIYREGRAFVGDGPVSAEALANRLRLLDESMSLYLLATLGDEGKPCGWLELHRLTPARLKHVAVLTLAVSRPFRGRGVATELLKYAYGWAREVGVEKVQLNVRAGNRAAIALYERQGFELEGRERKQVREGSLYEDNLLMAKFL